VTGSVDEAGLAAVLESLR